MNYNVYVFENQMLERKSEVEKSAAAAWKWSMEKKPNEWISGIVSKLKVAKHHVDVQKAPACCSCC